MYPVVVARSAWPASCWIVTAGTRCIASRVQNECLVQWNVPRSTPAPLRIASKRRVTILRVNGSP